VRNRAATAASGRRRALVAGRPTGVPDFEARFDVSEWPDNGCRLNPRCLECPLPVCKDDLGLDSRRYLNLDRNRRIREAAETGATLPEVAEKIGVSLTTVRRVMGSRRLRDGGGRVTVQLKRMTRSQAARIGGRARRDNEESFRLMSRLGGLATKEKHGSAHFLRMQVALATNPCSGSGQRVAVSAIKTAHRRREANCPACSKAVRVRRCTLVKHLSPEVSAALKKVRGSSAAPCAMDVAPFDTPVPGAVADAPGAAPASRIASDARGSAHSATRRLRSGSAVATAAAHPSLDAPSADESCVVSASRSGASPAICADPINPALAEERRGPGRGKAVCNFGRQTVVGEPVSEQERQSGIYHGSPPQTDARVAARGAVGLPPRASSGDSRVDPRITKEKGPPLEAGQKGRSHDSHQTRE
jgi:hypothetical protein